MYALHTALGENIHEEQATFSTIQNFYPSLFHILSNSNKGRLLITILLFGDKDITSGIFIRERKGRPKM